MTAVLSDQPMPWLMALVTIWTVALMVILLTAVLVVPDLYRAGAAQIAAWLRPEEPQ